MASGCWGEHEVTSSTYVLIAESFQSSLGTFATFGFVNAWGVRVIPASMLSVI